MMKHVWKFHNWYDRQPEPRRFLLLLFLVLPVITPNLWVNSPGTVLAWFGYLGILLGPRVYRHHAKVKPE